jgi:uncharacterized protein (DUF885 family)
MRLLRFAILLLLLNSLSAAAATEADRLNAFFQQDWEWYLREYPVLASRIGDFRYNDRLGDYSLEAVRRRHQHDLDVLEKLKSFDRSQLPPADQLNIDLYLRDTQLSIEGYQLHILGGEEGLQSYLIPITQLGGIHQFLPLLGRFLPYRNTKDYEDYLSRLSQIPAAIEDTVELMEEGLARMITPTRVAVRDVADQIQAQVTEDPEESPFYEPFKSFPETVPADQHDALRKAAKEIILEKIVPAFRSLHIFWTKQYYPNTRESVGVSHLPNGNEWYAFAARASTTTELSPQEIHEIGKREVQRIRSEMEEIIRKTGFKGSFAEFLEFLRTDPQFFYTKPEDLLTAYRDICKRIDPELPGLFGKLPRLTYGVREIPAFSAPSQTTAYYNAGSLKSGVPAWYYANTYRLETRPKWEMEALSIHEAVPGHHLQIALAQELENVPEFRKYASYTAFVEGWALYSESLGSEMGLYRDPYSKFGQLTYEMWRAVRLVVDTGMHVMGWSRQQAIDFFKANSSKPEHDITVEIDRYIVWPGQALAYKIGELKIKELKKYAAEQLGDRFDIREFHDHVLANGAVPLSILEWHIKDYVAAKKSR